MHPNIKSVLRSLPSCQEKEICLRAWVRSVRRQKACSFFMLNDGSCLSGIQVVSDKELPSALTLGSSVEVWGRLVESPGKGQNLELQASKILLIGTCSEDYPLQKKRHSFPFLREIAHLRPRSNTFGAIARVRNALTFATHTFFQEKNFICLHAPVITSLDCEGAGEMFRVESDRKDFFPSTAHLTVSAQLNAEIYASAFSNVYSFGPTFRAENSHTSRHLSEFWMLEPEMAFADLSDDMDNAQDYIQFVCRYLLEHCIEDLNFFNKFIDTKLLSRLEALVQKDFVRISYTDAIDVLSSSKVSFEHAPQWGKDLQSEHERYLAEEYIQGPVFVTDYPKDIKAFYMRLNEDNKTVAAMDLLLPKVGELIGGSQREERHDCLKERMEEENLPLEDYQWYLDLRRYGSVPHAGYGVGFERLVQFVTGMENIRDVIAFPRSPGQLRF